MPPIVKSTLLKLALGLTVSVATLAIPFYCTTPEAAVSTIKHWGYWLMLTTCCLFLWQSWSVLQKVTSDQLSKLAKQHYLGLLLAAVIACFLQSQDEKAFKILYDEHMLSSTAMNLHDQQMAYVQASGYSFDGETVASIGHVDKRPLLFPFILATVHNVFGYEYKNVFALNVMLTFITLSLLYGLLAQLTDRNSAYFGLLVFGGLPLLAQNACGGGYELLNLCGILLLTLSALHYYRQEKGTKGLDFMIITAILLANVRYESLLYLLVPVAVFLIKSVRTRKMQLTWFSVLSPCLIMLPLMNFAVFQSDPRFFITTKENFFSLSHFPGNFRHALSYLFNWDGSQTNSLLLSIVGVFGLVLFAFYLAPRILRLRETGDRRVVLIPMLCLVLTNTVLALCHHWGAWTDPTTSRFSLPLQLFMVICATLILNQAFRKNTASAVLIFIAGLQLIFATPAQCLHMREDTSLVFSKGYNWVMDWAEQHSPTGNHLYLAQSASGLGLLQVSAIPFDTANAWAERIFSLKKSGIYEEIFAVQAFIVTDEEASPLLADAGTLSARFNLETCAQYQVNSRVLYRISRVTSLKLLREGEGNVKQSPEPAITAEQLKAPDYFKRLPLAP